MGHFVYCYEILQNLVFAKIVGILSVCAKIISFFAAIFLKLPRAFAPALHRFSRNISRRLIFPRKFLQRQILLRKFRENLPKRHMMLTSFAFFSKSNFLFSPNVVVVIFAYFQRKFLRNAKTSGYL
jgi:hypothetical protein